MTDQRFGPEQRVKRRADFLRIQNDGVKYTSTHFMLSVLPSDMSFAPSRLRASANLDTKSPDIRIGITVTTKVDKRSARRNRLKRRVRECFRKTRKRFVKTSVDIVLIARGGATELDYHRVVKEFHYLLYQANILPSR